MHFIPSRFRAVPLAAVILGAFALPLRSAHADTLLFSDNFDAGTSASNWNTFRGGGTDSFVDYAFDYSTLGISSAPNSTGGSTVGMRFLANQSAGVLQGISASLNTATPGVPSVSGDFKIQFDSWLNFNGPFPGGGSGSTQLGTFGWGSDGTGANTVVGSQGIMFGATTDGNSASDYRVYKNGTNLAASGTSIYAAGSQNNSAAYYAPLGSHTAPAAQLALYPGQTGSTSTGTFGMAWHDVVLQKTGNSITWTVDGLLIGTGDTTGITGTNINFGLSDTVASSSTDVNDFLINSIYDNVRITQIEATPEPSTYAMMALGCIAMAVMGWQRKKNSGATLEI